ncbi:MAG TPA: hypothetical protein VM689_25715 [Aliidongia sp.]|nr:hypothetical protein [Aliidongia sp.]
MSRYGMSFSAGMKAAAAATLLFASTGAALAASSSPILGVPSPAGVRAAPSAPPRVILPGSQIIAPPLNLGQTNINPAGTGGVNQTGSFPAPAAPSSGLGTGLPANGTVDSSLGVTGNQ